MTDGQPLRSTLAGVLVAPRTLELRTFALPPLLPGQALVRIRATALCTWEQRTYLGVQDIKTPFVGGHEVAGEVVELGPDTAMLAVGDHVALGPTPCGQCFYCRRDFPARCVQLIGLGRFSVDGAWGPWGLAEYKPVPAQGLHRLPADLPFAEAALAEPVSCVVHSLRKLGPGLGDDVVVIGAGPMGLLNVLLLKLCGVRVIVCELAVARRDKARQLGADVVVDPAAGDVVATVHELTDGRGADAVVAAVGSARVNDLAFSLVGKTGKVVLFASAYPSAPLAVDHNFIHKGEVDVLGVEGKGVDDFRRAVKLLGARLIDVRPLIDRIVPLADIQTAFELATRPDSYRVVVAP